MTTPVTQTKTRTPLGRQPAAALTATVLRVVGTKAKTPALDVAAFQSFAG